MVNPKKHIRTVTRDIKTCGFHKKKIIVFKHVLPELMRIDKKKPERLRRKYVSKLSK